jgi:hypothetical protein
MKRFIDKTFKPVFIIGGLGTAAAGLYAFWPQFAIQNVARLEFIQDQTIFVQHWGIMVGLMGVFMIAAALIPSWRMPIVIYSTVEKSFMVFLVLSSLDHAYAAGFFAPATMDAVIVIYSLLYFLSLKEDRRA